ncbi:hypothetical protein [Cytobacillus gottheilii]|uniref:hypothetical protein n=1 Tax=Cytobacillus gottheilii TaxID=859144 RepID=UPI0021472F8B|nr:hypothetical protein [Cytobacillus gottheilii]
MTILITVVGWGIIAYIAIRIYRKQTVKPKIWKIMIVLFAGLFTFSFHWVLIGTLLRIPLLPLGVWVLYFILKRKEGRWETYRKFAWLGFLGNFIFLALTLLAIPLQQLVYPDNPSTYISNIENASVIHIHPSAEEQILNKESLLNQMETMKEAAIMGGEWYEETFAYGEENIVNERFPYQLIELSPRWGSGISAIIYIEEDGKGLLITTPEKQLYLRSEESLLKGGE